MDLNHRQIDDLKRLVLGEKLGAGVYRTVYEYALDPKLVVKVEKDDGCFANVREWDLWQEVESMPTLRDWFAPVVAISPCGLLLVQRRTKRITRLDRVPEKVPEFFTDLKIDNWGKLGKRYVCHDYAMHLATRPTTRLKKAKWREE